MTIKHFIWLIIAISLKHGGLCSFWKDNNNRINRKRMQNNAQPIQNNVSVIGFLIPHGDSDIDNLSAKQDTDQKMTLETNEPPKDMNLTEKVDSNFNIASGKEIQESDIDQLKTFVSGHHLLNNNLKGMLNGGNRELGWHMYPYNQAPIYAPMPMMNPIPFSPVAQIIPQISPSPVPQQLSQLSSGSGIPQLPLQMIGMPTFVGNGTTGQSLPGPATPETGWSQPQMVLTQPIIWSSVPNMDRGDGFNNRNNQGSNDMQVSGILNLLKSIMFSNDSDMRSLNSLNEPMEFPDCMAILGIAMQLAKHPIVQMLSFLFSRVIQSQNSFDLLFPSLQHTHSNNFNETSDILYNDTGDDLSQTRHNFRGKLSNEDSYMVHDNEFDSSHSLSVGTNNILPDHLEQNIDKNINHNQDHTQPNAQEDTKDTIKDTIKDNTRDIDILSS